MKMKKDLAARKPNRLINETSPYLLQHAHNPVDWHPWGAGALEKAKSEDKPILLSIGYSSCHWCHVMAHESFEDDAVAAVMNRDFVCVKVDREERPDLDDIYMKATQAMNQGQGGWPMTVFLTPDQKPFFAGTYFPPEDRYGRPGFKTLLENIAELWKTQRADLAKQAESLTGYLQASMKSADGMAVGETELRAFVDQLWYAFDDRRGGFGSAPKFPPHGDLLLLFRCHRRFGDERAIQMAVKTLDEMARGGIYDQIGGGFHRYSVDADWLVPHFEKMLYDNAQLAAVYIEGYQATGNVFYRRIAAEILDYVLREMTAPEGGFYSATDADSEGEEGKFFVWTRAEVESILGAEPARKFCAYYDISERGNWEGKNIPNTPKPVEEVAASLGIKPDDLECSLAESRKKMHEARQKRVAPGLDDKILTAWNGLMIESLAEGHRVLGDPRYLAAATCAADFILETMRSPDGRLFRAYRAGTSHVNAFLEDHANFACALISLYECGAATRYLQEARKLADRIMADFSDASGGGFFSAPADHEKLIVRTRDGHDSAVPSDNAVAARALARLAFHFAQDRYRDAAVSAVRAYGRAIASTPRAFARSLIVTDFLLNGPVELALVGSPSDSNYEALRREVSKYYLPHRIVAHHDPSAGAPPDLPLLQGKELVNGKAALYVCRNFSCRSPVTDPSDVERVLGEERPDTAPAVRTSIGKRLAGAATPDGTRRYAERFRTKGIRHGYGPLGSTGLTVSRVGFGCYRIDNETEEHAAALEKALLSGCNVVDTSTNYADGASERAVGMVVNRLVRDGKLARDEVVLISKVGYVQGANLELAAQREESGRPFPEMVKYAEGLWHCMHPEFLSDQLTRSLDRLECNMLDVCLIHNPEYFLSEKKDATREPLEEVRTEFYRRLGEAFVYLESQVKEGRIRWYGVSSNTCVLPPGDREATSLTRILGAAREAAGGSDHHFRVIQFPMNLLEPGAALEPNCGLMQPLTILDCAIQNGIGTLANRPLNALMKDTMIRIADPVVPQSQVSVDAQTGVVGRLEADYRRDIAPALRSSAPGVNPEDFFRWSDELSRLKSHRPNLEQWVQIEEMMLLPRVLTVVQALDQNLARAEAGAWTRWRDTYLAELQKLLLAFRRDASIKSREEAQAVSRSIDPGMPEDRRRESLARKALWILASTPGLSCVLNGMRRGSYVDDALSILSWAPMSDPLRLYQSLKDDPPAGRRVSLIVP